MSSLHCVSEALQAETEALHALFDLYHGPQVAQGVEVARACRMDRVITRAAAVCVNEFAVTVNMGVGSGFTLVHRRES
jgi:hypothetical protein